LEKNCFLLITSFNCDLELAQFHFELLLFQNQKLVFDSAQAYTISYNK